MLGDETLRTIARELVATVRKNVTIDRTIRDNVRAQLRVLVKRILRNRDRLLSIPRTGDEDRPSKDFIRWHNEHVFVG